MAICKPILFSTPMVRAILDGRKTMTRRVIKPQPAADAELTGYRFGCPQFSDGITGNHPYNVGNILWVRETWARQFGLYWHKAGLEVDENGYCKDGYWAKDAAAPGGKIYIATKAPEKWKPSIHMPKEACRIFLRATGIRVERLQEISNSDAKEEGILPEKEWPFDDTPREMFAYLWDGINAKRNGGAYAWEKNPWVWVVSFERTEKPEGWPERSKT